MKNLITCLVVCVMSSVAFTGGGTPDRGDCTPSAPFLFASTDECNVVILSWETIDNADVYSIYKGVTASPSRAVFIGQTIDTVFVDSCGGAHFYYWVAAINDCGSSILSNYVMSSCVICNLWTVDDDGKADFDNIQAAVDAASDGDEIVVMPGTYTGTGDEVVDMLGKAVWLHSSKGEEVTIIDGEGTRKGITCNTEETIETVIEGFTVTNCYAQHGGGIDCISSNPLLRNCKFVNSEAYLYGGGMRAWNSNPTLDGCLFSGNTAFRGGGIACHDGHSIIENCTVENNIASDGGGIWCDAISNPLLTGNVICSNELNNISGPWTDKGENIITASCNDQDSDNVQDDIDNCYLYNPDQLDCNDNDIGDVCDIADETSTDWNGNDIPDDCECLADINADGVTNTDDLLTLIANWGNNSGLGDVNFDGIVDVSDLLIVIGNWGPCE